MYVCVYVGVCVESIMDQWIMYAAL